MAGDEPRILPLTPSRWADFEKLFGPRGACAGCWCMEPRLTHAEWERGRGDKNRRAMKRLVDSRRRPPGLLAYLGREAAGWISVEPRGAFSKLARSRVLAPVDEKPVWSIVCFFVARRFRNQGVSVALLRGAVDYARRKGARLIEGYPVEPRSGKAAPVFVYTGLASAYRKAGFREVARRAPTRPIMRRAVRPR